MCALALPVCLLLALLLVAPPAARAHTYHMGSCPQIPPMKGFVTSKFLGRWHVLQKTATRVRCLSDEFSWASGAGAGGGRAARGEWADEQEEGGDVALLQRMQLPVPGINNLVRYAGALRPDPDPARAGAFSARFPLNVLGAVSFVVFDTDYDSYAAVYSCQKLALWYRHSASIMARGRTLDSGIVQKLRAQLRVHGVNVDSLKVIRQTCDDDAEDRGVQVHIKPKVFRTNATDILEDANDVVATAADAAKRAFEVYNTVNTVYTGIGRATSGLKRRRRQAPLERVSPRSPAQLQTLDASEEVMEEGEATEAEEETEAEEATQEATEATPEARAAEAAMEAEAERRLFWDWMP